MQKVFAAMAAFVASMAGAPASASVIYQTDIGSFLPASAASRVALGEIGGAGDAAASDHTRLAAGCQTGDTCLASLGADLFAINADVLRRCDNAIPDRSSPALLTCVYDHSTTFTPPGGGDFITADDDAYSGATFAFSSDASSLGFLLSGSGQQTIDFTINGVSGSIALQGPTFAGFLGDGPLHGSFSSSGLIRISSFYEGAVGVPEPATWAMMILGMAAVGAAMRRRQLAPRAARAG